VQADGRKAALRGGVAHRWQVNAARSNVTNKQQLVGAAPRPFQYCGTFRAGQLPMKLPYLQAAVAEAPRASGMLGVW
jgi:hypothetical protein